MRIVPKLFVFSFVVLMAATVFGQDVYRNHMLIEVYPESEARLKALYQFHQLDIIPGPSRDIPHIAAYPEDLELLQAEGYPYEIIHENLEKFYADRIDGRLDDMGGYHTYSEIVTFLDQIHADHPTITTAKFSIGQSLEGREIWGIKISDNPDVDENEPEVFFNALTHAREPMGMEVLLYFIDYLTDNYGDSADVTYVVDNREIFVIACMNPDGYVYNETTNPGGGGMWRKNRKYDSGSGCYGVDLNRNYGAYWGYDNDGSSPYPCDPTYRGTAAFSEPETQAVRDFILSRNFVSGCDNHTHGEWLLVPYGSSSFGGDGYTDDHDTFMMVVDSMAQLIYEVRGTWYTAGPPWETLHYNVNGGSFDWEYDSVGMFSISPELGTSFWPSSGDILPSCQEWLPANIFFARIAGSLAPRPYAIAYNGQCQSEWSGDGDGATEPGEGLELTVTIENSGTDLLVNLHGTLATTDPYASVAQAESDWPTLASDETGENTTDFQVSVSAGCPATYFIPLTLHMTADGGLDTTLNLMVTVGVTMLADDVESGTGEWITGGTGDLWHISTRRADSPTHSWYCGNEVGGEHNNNMNCWLLSDILILPADATLSWDHWYDLEFGYDYGYVEMDTGTGWTAVGSSVNGASGSWVHEEEDLGITCNGTMAQIRFRLFSDTYVTEEGWYIDNVSVTGPPGKVTDLVISSDGNDIHLYWQASSNAGGYSIRRSLEPFGTFTEIGTVVADSLHFEHTNGAVSDVRAFYIVVATD